MPMFVAVVDDEIDLACLFRDALSQIDEVRVFAFSDPHLALEHFQINHHNYTVVISDYRMPGMTGIQLFEKMKEINPTVTRMLMSAFEIQDKLFEQCKCIDKFLQKPLAMINLIEEVKLQINKMPILNKEPNF